MAASLLGIAAPQVATAAVNAASVCLGTDGCRTTWPTGGGGSGLTTAQADAIAANTAKVSYDDAAAVAANTAAIALNTAKVSYDDAAAVAANTAAIALNTAKVSNKYTAAESAKTEAIALKTPPINKKNTAAGAAYAGGAPVPQGFRPISSPPSCKKPKSATKRAQE